MPGFKDNSDGSPGWRAWEGDPDNVVAHQTILSWLQSAVNGNFLNADSSLTNSIKGNLGEFIAYRIGDTYVFTNGPIAHTANAWDPLSNIS